MLNFLLNPVVVTYGYLKAAFKKTASVAVTAEHAAVAMVTPTPTLASVLAPFQDAVTQLSAVEAAARTQEQTLRAQAAATLAEADGVAKQVQQAAAIQQNFSKLLGL